MPETNDLPQINQTGEYQSSRCLVVFGTKGGVGKTVIAANLAVCLAQRSGKPVCLLDIDVTGTGDLAKMLGLKVTHTVAGMVTKARGRSIGQLDWPVADLVAAHPSGIHVIQCVDHPSQRQLLDAPLIHALFSSLRRRYDYIIVDAGKGFTDPLIAAFDEANLILLVATPEIISLYQTKWAMNLIESLLFPPNMVKAVLNRAESRGGVNTRDARVAMPCEFIGEIPSDGRAMVTAINQGQAVVNLYDRSKISEAFRRLAEILVTTPNLFLSHQELSRRKETPSTEEATGAAGGVHGAVRFFAHPAGATTPGQDQADEIVRMKRRIHQQLVEELDLKKVDLTLLTNENSMLEMRSRCQQVVANLLSREMGGLISSREVRTRLVEEILDEALGLGPLEELLDDSSISDILVNNKDQIYVERSGKLELTRKKFLSDDQVRAVMERIVAPLGRRIDESSPMVDARLPDGSRVNAIIPPLSVHGPVLSIRKFTGVRFTQDDLVRLGTLTPSMAQFIRACVLARKNLIISGGTGSGKTTLLNIVSAFIPENERIITIEDAAELRLNQEHWVSLEARPSNVEGRGQITIRDLFRNALRMRPDRIMIGECRGAETLDMLQAMNTGHDGSFTTLHANSPRDVVNRLDSLVLMSNIELPVRAIREMVASAISIIVHTSRLSDGSRKVVSISEVSGIVEGMEIGLKDVFLFQQTGVAADGTVLGEYVATGYVPSFYNELKVKGIAMDEAAFHRGSALTAADSSVKENGSPSG